MLDAGHGGTDEGTKMRSFREKKITLMTALYAKRELEAMGYRVILTRFKDVSVSLVKRTKLANQSRVALFVSIHFNASQNPLAKGIEVYYCGGKKTERTTASRRLASLILHHLLDETESRSRGVKTGNFHVIRETQMPSVLVEGGFVTNREERIQLKDKNYLAKIAKGIAKGVDHYAKNCVLGASRTRDLPLRRRPLYPPELRGQDT